MLWYKTLHPRSVSKHLTGFAGTAVKRFMYLLQFGSVNMLMKLYSTKVFDVSKGMRLPVSSIWTALVTFAIINVISRVREKQRQRQ